MSWTPCVPPRGRGRAVNRRGGDGQHQARGGSRGPGQSRAPQRPPRGGPRGRGVYPQQQRCAQNGECHDGDAPNGACSSTPVGGLLNGACCTNGPVGGVPNGACPPMCPAGAVSNRDIPVVTVPNGACPPPCLAGGVPNGHCLSSSLPPCETPPTTLPPSVAPPTTLPPSVALPPALPRGVATPSELPPNGDACANPPVHTGPAPKTNGRSKKKWRAPKPKMTKNKGCTASLPPRPPGQSLSAPPTAPQGRGRGMVGMYPARSLDDLAKEKRNAGNQRFGQ
ncbi:classical arabinogalactan protein 9-like [Aplysia californica]|uniref:Classical arabinogalactan protein 9-like n=1 Tax=Aplysia californica TaxID=6500 RepID=A0ABM1VUX2_APLCA|nr:classical arabinogalactan protein 9-like [Aplysia californica]